jgi:hypothetical protein
MSSPIPDSLPSSQEPVQQVYALLGQLEEKLDQVMPLLAERPPVAAKIGKRMRLLQAKFTRSQARRVGRGREATGSGVSRRRGVGEGDGQDDGEGERDREGDGEGDREGEGERDGEGDGEGDREGEGERDREGEGNGRHVGNQVSQIPSNMKILTISPVRTEGCTDNETSAEDSRRILGSTCESDSHRIPVYVDREQKLHAARIGWPSEDSYWLCPSGHHRCQ